MWSLYNETSTVQCTLYTYNVHCKVKLRCRVQRDHTYLCDTNKVYKLCNYVYSTP